MPVGLITNAGGGIPAVTITASTQNVDLAALLGNPVSNIEYRLIVLLGVVVGSSVTTSVSLDATGLTADSVGTWDIQGKILGAGGDGGDGWGTIGTDRLDGGGGGGGAGSIIGTGGLGAFTGLDGAAGDADFGGTGGESFLVTSGELAGSPGIAGGDSVTLNHPVTINVSGTIGGGGGGGDGAFESDGGFFDDGGNGGDLGEEGGNGGSPGATQGAAAGFAIRYSGSGDATINLIDSGAVHGTVG